MALAYRPVLRTNLARSLYERMQKEEELRNYDKTQWYRCNKDALYPDSLRGKFIENHFDRESEDFLDKCQEKSDWIITQIFHAVAKSLLCWFMTRTSVNGFLNRGSMYVFSRAQFETLMDLSPSQAKSQALLDLGAGDGAVTKIMSHYFQKVYVTEMSPVMKRLLQKQNFKVLEVEDWFQDDGITYDVISCLNLLDRCVSPLTLISQMKGKLKPKTGILLVAIVLPLSQYVESVRNHTALEELPVVDSACVEVQLSQLVENVFQPLGLEVVRWTKLPYLSEGDLEQYFYWLEDYVLVLKVKEES